MKVNPANLQAALSKKLLAGNKKRTSRGPLHDRMTKFLPDFIEPGDGCASIHRIAMALGMSNQGVYKMMRPGVPNRIEPKIAEMLVELSSLSKKRDSDFRPATIADFWEFVNV